MRTFQINWQQTKDVLPNRNEMKRRTHLWIVRIASQAVCKCLVYCLNCLCIFIHLFRKVENLRAIWLDFLESMQANAAAQTREKKIWRQNWKMFKNSCSVSNRYIRAGFFLFIHSSIRNSLIYFRLFRAIIRQRPKWSRLA